MKRVALMALLLLSSCSRQNIAEISVDNERNIYADTVVVEKYRFFDNRNDTVVIRDSVSVFRNVFSRDSVVHHDTVVLKSVEKATVSKGSEGHVLIIVLLVILMILMIWRKRL